MFMKLLKLKKCPTIWFSLRKISETTTDVDIYEMPRKKPSNSLLPTSLYGGRHLVTMIPGGGIGPELMKHVKNVFYFCGAPVDFETVQIDPKLDSNEDLQNAITSIRRNAVGIKGSIETHSKSTSVICRNAALRNYLDMYVYVLHCRSYPNVRAIHKNIDIVIIRQNTEGEYAMLEHENVSGVVESLKIITRKNSERVARYAFENARKYGRKRVTIVHRADYLVLSDGLFLQTAYDVGKNYPEIKQDDINITNCCTKLTMNPGQFDVMLMTNLYGAVISNIACGLAGGAGLQSGKNYGKNFAVFETGTRNTGTTISQPNSANPVAMLNASADMLEYLGHERYAKLIRKAIWKTLTEDKIHTPDLGGSATTDEVVKCIKKNILKSDRMWSTSNV